MLVFFDIFFFDGAAEGDGWSSSSEVFVCCPFVARTDLLGSSGSYHVSKCHQEVAPGISPRVLGRANAGDAVAYRPLSRIDTMPHGCSGVDRFTREWECDASDLDDFKCLRGGDFSISHAIRSLTGSTNKLWCWKRETRGHTRRE